jgi:hypothetical protein
MIMKAKKRTKADSTGARIRSKLRQPQSRTPVRFANDQIIYSVNYSASVQTKRFFDRLQRFGTKFASVQLHPTDSQTFASTKHLHQR